MGSPCLFARQQALKMGYFYWLHVKNSNPLHTELSLGFPKDAKFYLERKASFIDIRSIASFKLFLIAWLQRLFLANTWKKIGGHCARLREKEIFSVIELSLREISYVFHVHALMCAS